MTQIKYTYLTKKQTKVIFWTGSILGGLAWAVFGGLSAANPSNNWYAGFADAGLVLLAGTIAFFVGMLCKAKE